MALADLMKKAGALAPQRVLASAPLLHDRVLYIDGDGLAYYCSGNEYTTVAAAKERVRNTIRGMSVAAQTNRVRVLLTGSGSHKGHRYAVARVKAYQSQRSGSRPANWQALRSYMEAMPKSIMCEDFDREADDRFGEASARDPHNTVIATQDKDMRMMAGWHMDWVERRLRWVPPGCYDLVMNDKQYGLKWFWLQMLHGDSVDCIPGLPWVTVLGKTSRVGPVGAEKLLAGTATSSEAGLRVLGGYHSCYGDRYLVEMLEQAALLWMRTDAAAAWDNCAAPGNPLHQFTTHAAWPAAYNEIKERVALAQSYDTNPN